MSDEELQKTKGAPVPASKGKRSFFDDDATSYASKVEIDGQFFYFNPMSPEADLYERNWAMETAQKMGITLEEFKATKVFTDPEQARIFTEQSTALWNRVLCDGEENGLIDWSLPRACTETAKLKLWPDLKHDISDAIVAFSRFGISEARFRQLRGAAANRG